MLRGVAPPVLPDEGVPTSSLDPTIQLASTDATGTVEPMSQADIQAARVRQQFRDRAIQDMQEGMDIQESVRGSIPEETLGFHGGPADVVGNFQDEPDAVHVASIGRNNFFVPRSTPLMDVSEDITEAARAMEQVGIGSDELAQTARMSRVQPQQLTRLASLAMRPNVLMDMQSSTSIDRQPLGEVPWEQSVPPRGVMQAGAIVEQPQPPDAVIIHHYGNKTEGVRAEGLARSMHERGLGVQFIIDRNGRVLDTGVPMGAAHTRPGQRGTNPFIEGLSNRNTVGIEVIAENDGDVLPIQVRAATELINRNFSGVPVLGHGQIRPQEQGTEEGSTIAGAVRDMRAARALGNISETTQPSVGAFPTQAAPAAQVPDLNEPAAAYMRPMTPLQSALYDKFEDIRAAERSPASMVRPDAGAAAVANVFEPAPPEAMAARPEGPAQALPGASLNPPPSRPDMAWDERNVTTVPEARPATTVVAGRPDIPELQEAAFIPKPRPEQLSGQGPSSVPGSEGYLQEYVQGLLDAQLGKMVQEPPDPERVLAETGRDAPIPDLAAAAAAPPVPSILSAVEPGTAAPPVPHPVGRFGYSTPLTGTPIPNATDLAALTERMKDIDAISLPLPGATPDVIAGPPKPPEPDYIPDLLSANPVRPISPLDPYAAEYEEPPAEVAAAPVSPPAEITAASAPPPPRIPVSATPPASRIPVSRPPPAPMVPKQALPNNPILQRIADMGEAAKQRVTQAFEAIKNVDTMDPIETARIGATGQNGFFDSDSFWSALEEDPTMENETRQMQAARVAAQGASSNRQLGTGLGYMPQQRSYENYARGNPLGGSSSGMGRSFTGGNTGGNFYGGDHSGYSSGGFHGGAINPNR
jgi:hypothetical protein